jgi:hypothetical protein
MSLERLGLPEVTADPNFTCDTLPHVDVIKQKLLAAAIDGSPIEKENAHKLLEQMYGIAIRH